jgi:hypothetical protein
MSDLTPKSFRFDQATRDQLASLARQLDCSEAETVRWSLAALSGVLHHGLKDWTIRDRLPVGKPKKDGRRMIVLEGPHGRALILHEDFEGAFFPAHETGTFPAKLDAAGFVVNTADEDDEGST